MYKNNMQVNEVGSAVVGKAGWLMVDAVVVELWGLKSEKMTKNGELEAWPHEL